MGKHFALSWFWCCIIVLCASCAKTHQIQLDNHEDHRNYQHPAEKYSDPRRHGEDGSNRRPESIRSPGAKEVKQLSVKTFSKREDDKRGFSDENRKQMLLSHNMYRRNVTPPAADMRYVRWDDELESLAQEWADNCDFNHGFPKTKYSRAGFYGQNLYVGADRTGYQAMWLWYNEYHDYDVKTQFCQPRPAQCGHFKQMCFNTVYRMGCGVTKCDIEPGWDWMVVCHYYTPVYRRQQIYKIGTPCSQCEKGYKCVNNLCVSPGQCQEFPGLCDDESTCTLQCQNCGRLDKKTCTCQCADGYDRTVCDSPCVNKHPRCGQLPGFPTQSLCPYNDYKVATRECRKFCGTCNGLVPGNVTSHLCCGGKEVCEEGYVLDVGGTCKCILLCPGPKCDSAVAPRAGSSEKSTLSSAGPTASDGSNGVSTKPSNDSPSVTTRGGLLHLNTLESICLLVIFVIFMRYLNVIL